MNDCINKAALDFKEKYNYIFNEEINKIVINEEDCIRSMESLCNFIKNSKFRSKVKKINLNHFTSYIFL